MRSCVSRAGAQLVNELHRAGDRRAEADAIIGAVDIIIHRLRNGDYGKPSLCRRSPKLSVSSPPMGIRRSMPRNSRLRSTCGVKSRNRRVVGQFGVHQKLGHVNRLDFARIGAAGVQEGAACAVDGAHRVLVELEIALIVGGGIFRVEVEQTPPTAPECRRLRALRQWRRKQQP